MNSDKEPVSELKVAMIGGGSGGHLFPAIATAHAMLLQHPNTGFLFLVSHRSVDSRVMLSGNLPGDRVEVRSYITLPDNQNSVRRLLMLPEALRAFREAGKALRDFRPDVAVGVGALASVPGVLAASRLRIPIALMEQNARPGKANRFLAKRARITIAGMPFSSRFSQDWPGELIVTGTPVRSQIVDLYGQSICRSAERPHLLILGGSQGSHSVNRLVLEALADERCVPSDWQIIHQTGEAQVREVASQYEQRGRTAIVLSFLPNLPELLARATLVISRSGAGTLQELACAGLPSILVPFSRAAGDHQLVNARHFAAAGAAEIIEETHDDAAQQLRILMNRLIAEPDLRLRYSENIRKFARPDAAAESARILIQLAQRTL